MREVLTYQAPLHGRASAQMYLKPLTVGLTHKFFPRSSTMGKYYIVYRNSL
jgi:hypothetical protein